jgi:hypothetical protein
MRNLLLAGVGVFGLLATPAFADSFTMSSFPVAGTIGGPGGSHTVVIDGVSCKLKNSTQGPNAGCNYTLSGGVSAMGQGKIDVKTGNQGCSTSCQ